MPNIDECLIKLKHASYLSTLDMTKGFWQVPLNEEARKVAAFVTPNGHWQFKKMPFGLVNSTATFNRLMKLVLRDVSVFCQSFVDDVVIFSDSFEEHCTHVDKVFNAIKKAGLTVKPSKIQLGYSELKFLGFVVGSGVMRPNAEKINHIKMTPTPRTKKDIRSFLGILNFYQRFIPNLADKIFYLTELLKGKSNQIEWNEKANDEFKEIKKFINDNMWLKIPKANETFILYTDASNTGLGAALYQIQDLKEVPIYFISMKLNNAQKKYSTVEKECLAVVWAMKKFDRYLLGKEFILKTDHKALLWLLDNHSKGRRLTRWALEIQEYFFKIQFIKGSENIIADYLSRC